MNDPLYSKDLLRLAASAYGAGRLDRPDACHCARNPACGDETTVDLAIENGRIKEMAHDSKACVLAQASAAILAKAAPGLEYADLVQLKAGLSAMLQGGPPPDAPFSAYDALRAAAAAPGRHACVLLPVEAAIKAMRGTSKE